LLPVASADQLESVLGVVGPLVAAVGPDQWDAPTPCADWDVRALLGHLVGGNQLVAGILTGRTTLAQARSAPAADPLGTDPTGAYRDSAAAVVGAFRAPGVLERPVTVPFGTVPGSVALHLRIVEVLVHGWDLARATGRTVSFPDEVVEQEVAFSREALPRIAPDRSPFAASRSVDGAALPLDRLVALLGREPHPR
jgi:uncharacterized protein (TIGR03086 family)